MPKFASFKPKAEDTPKLPPSEPQEDRVKIGHHNEDREHHRSRNSKHRSHGQRHERKKSRSPDRRQPEPSPREQPLYVVDKRGDPLIVRYGSNERAKIPSYRRSGKGRVMGSEGRLRLIHDGSKELFSLGDRLGEGPSAFRDRALLSKASRRKTRVFKLRSSSDETQALPDAEELDFLPLSDTRKLQDSRKDLAEDSGGEEINYRSIRGKAKARDFVDSDLESADSSDTESEADLDRTSPARQRSVELSRRVKEYPEDIAAWLELIELQADSLRLNEDARLDKSNDEIKGLASIRVSLYEEALSHVKDKAGRETLLLGLLREGSRVWSSKTLAKRWAEVSLKESSLALWRAYLNYKLSSITSFAYDSIKQLHIERLQSLKQRLDQEVRDARAQHDGQPLQEICREQAAVSEGLSRTYDEFIYVFTTMTCFIRAAGYSELAVASWQALLELTFARPADYSDNVDEAELISSFRDFWESEVPRIGEEGAKGWRQFTEAEEMADLPEAKTEALLTQPDTRDYYKAWAAVEAQRSRNAALPARTLDEGTDADPFRLVMFADLEPLFFLLPAPLLALPRAKSSTVTGFLLFCGLPAPLLDTGDIILDLRDDPFLDCEGARLNETDLGPVNGIGDGERKPPRFSDPSRRLVESPDVMFSQDKWFGFFDRDVAPVQELARVVTAQLASNFEFDPIAQYSMGLAWNKDPAAVRRAAKALLKKWPNKTSLYLAYAFAEWRNDNRSMASNVLTSAASQDLAHKDRLWTTWAWLDIEAGNMQDTLAKCIASTADSNGLRSTPATSSQLLKARQALQSSRDFLLSSGDISKATVHAETIFLLEYASPGLDSAETRISRQGDVETAFQNLDSFASEAVAKGHGNSAHLERLLQSAAHLLYLHANRGPFRPTKIRDQLRTYIALFPANSIFLRLFAWADTMIIVNDPVRELLRAYVLTRAHDCLASRVFAIQHELRAGAGSSAHAARAAFEQALDSDACRVGGAAGLWRSYVRFCKAHAKELRGSGSGAKDVFYRALGACPWSKELIMEAFSTLAGDMESAELSSLWNTMATKGLRIHVDSEEFRAEWAHRKSRRG